MSSVRFGAALADVAPSSILTPDPVVQDSFASAALLSLIVLAKPRRFYIWVYDLQGERVAVIA